MSFVTMNDDHSRPCSSIISCLFGRVARHHPHEAMQTSASRVLRGSGALDTACTEQMYARNARTHRWEVSIEVKVLHRLGGIIECSTVLDLFECTGRMYV